MKLQLIRRPAGKCLADLLVVAVLIPVGLVVLAGCLRTGGRSHETANRVKCAMNLKSVGQALLLYANENGSALPRTRYATGPTVAPTWGTGAATTQPFSNAGPAANDVSAALYLLVRTQNLHPEIFVCVSSDATPLRAATAMDFSNWAGGDGVRNHLSYSFQNPYADDAAVALGFKFELPLPAEYALAADINPGAGGKNENVLNVAPGNSAKVMKQGNSPNHQYDGQNILYGDCHVSFENTPFSGISNDNIYARRAAGTGYASSAVVASPFDAEDNVLLPTND
jgi:hypothetical protein